MEDNQEQYYKMIHNGIAGLVLSLALPTIASMLVTSIYNMADTYFVARLGTSATGAVGIVLSLMAMIQAIGFTLGMGSATKVSILLGDEDVEQANTYGMGAMAAAVTAGILMTAAGLYYLTPLLRLLGATSTMLPYALEYGRYIMIAAPFMCLSFVLNNLLRAEGKARFAMVSIVTGALFNIALDAVLILGFSMGVAGAGISTAVSQVLSCMILLYWYLAKKTVLCLQLKWVVRKPSVYWEILKNGFPSFVRQGLVSVATALTNVMAAVYGDEMVAGISVMNRIFLFLFSVIVGFVQGYSPVAGYNYGADKIQRVKKAFVFAMNFGIVVMSLLAFGACYFAEFLVGLFGIEPGITWDTAVTALRYQCVLLPLILAAVVCNMTYQAMGKAVSATFLAACRQGIFLIPFIYIFPKFWGFNGILLAQPAADLAAFFSSIPFTVKFMKKTKRR
ncbi:MAG: MATE family efflux transporter [Lachnospiraceae bacterium]|nr:MATE family efflux transporter [Lachnospiraceae bacterium]